ncbi:MAG: XkdX family protein [Limosilactobacillus mucosae]|nr:XkdX family protein [Limosilactobacillus mucosae]
MFGIYKSYYEMKLFTKDDLDLFVEVGDLSADQENQILGVSTSTGASESTSTATSQA